MFAGISIGFAPDSGLSLSASTLHYGWLLYAIPWKYVTPSIFMLALLNLAGLCRRRGWQDPMYECYRDVSGYTCLVLVNGREYQTDLAYESDGLAQENAAMRAFMVCRNFSVNGGMLARNGIVQGLPTDQGGRTSKHRKGSRHHSSSHHSHSYSRRSGHSSSSSTTTLD